MPEAAAILTLVVPCVPRDVCCDDRWEQAVDGLNISLEIEWAFQMMQMLALGCVKLSFLFFYRRVFTIGTSTCFSKITFGMIIIVLLWTAAFFFALLFACKGNWSAWLSLDVDLSTKCGNALQFELGMATSDFVTDVLIMVLPIPMMDEDKKMEVLSGRIRVQRNIAQVEDWA
ncbi:MAG: hypothetical protein Q9194_002874 [Teloschistes cf. exilis]